MSTLRDTHINNNLNVSSGVMVDNKIINNDIVAPIITISGTDSSRVIQVNVRKFNNNLTSSGRPKLHWWISSNSWSYPSVIPGGGNQPFATNNGVNLDPTTIANSAVLRTSETDSSHIYKITIGNGSLNSSSQTYYFMCEVQGIVYQQSFTIYTDLDLSSLGTLAQWYNPAQLTTATISSWTDSSGNGHNLDSRGTVTPSTSSYNGVKTLIIGTSNAMMARGQTTTFDQPNQTIFLVVKSISGYIFGDYGSTSNQLILFDSSSAGYLRFYARDTSANIMQVTTVPKPNGATAFNIYGLVVDGTNRNIKVYTSTGSLLTNSNASYTNTTTWNGLYAAYASQSWGSLGTTATNQAGGNCEVGEIVIYSHTQSVANINAIGQYLANKYSMSWTNF